MATPLTLHLDKGSGTSITTDRPNEYALLSQDDSLALTLRNSWASTDGITRVDFYAGEATKAHGAHSTTHYWTPDSSVGMGGIFKFDVTKKSGTAIRTLKMTDLEDPGSNDEWWYRVEVGNSVLDPEIMNKAGSGGGRWVQKTAAPV